MYAAGRNSCARLPAAVRRSAANVWRESVSFGWDFCFVSNKPKTVRYMPDFSDSETSVLSPQSRLVDSSVAACFAQAELPIRCCRPVSPCWNLRFVPIRGSVSFRQSFCFAPIEPLFGIGGASVFVNGRRKRSAYTHPPGDCRADRRQPSGGQKHFLSADFSSCLPDLPRKHQKGRSSFSSPGVNSGTEVGGGGGTGAPGSMLAPALTRSTFHARMLLNQRSFHWRASMSKDTVSSSPIWILNCSILSAPNTSKHILRGYWS